MNSGASLVTFMPVSRSGLDGDMFRSTAVLQRSASNTRRRSSADEDGARKALGTEQQLPAAIVAGASLENLARIALG